MDKTTIIPFFLEDSGALAAFTHLSHIDNYAPEDSLSCRLPVSSMILGKYPSSLKIRVRWLLPQMFIDFGYLRRVRAVGRLRSRRLLHL